jgi:hypothetical protein
MEMLLHSNGHLQGSTVALVMDVRNMWEFSKEGSHSYLHPFLEFVILGH